MTAILVPLRFPLPTSPTRGEVPPRIPGSIEQQAPDHTLPFMGRDGEGKSPVAKFGQGDSR
jgi:hypothetical protein